MSDPPVVIPSRARHSLAGPTVPAASEEGQPPRNRFTHTRSVQFGRLNRQPPRRRAEACEDATHQRSRRLRKVRLHYRVSLRRRGRRTAAVTPNRGPVRPRGRRRSGSAAPRRWTRSITNVEAGRHPAAASAHLAAYAGISGHPAQLRNVDQGRASGSNAPSSSPHSRPRPTPLAGPTTTANTPRARNTTPP
jgi:hypothetical protein